LLNKRIQVLAKNVPQCGGVFAGAVFLDHIRDVFFPRYFVNSAYRFLFKTSEKLPAATSP
jgi:hypothetical protein